MHQCDEAALVLIRRQLWYGPDGSGMPSWREIVRAVKNTNFPNIDDRKYISDTPYEFCFACVDT